MAYTNGNLAMQPKRKPQQQQQRQQQIVRETRRMVTVRRSLPTKEKLLYLLTIIAVVLVLGTVIFRYAQMYQMKFEVKQINDKTAKLNLQIGELQKQVETLKDPKTIAAEAAKHGYYLPEKDSEPITVKPKTSEIETASAVKD